MSTIEKLKIEYPDYASALVQLTYEVAMNAKLRMEIERLLTKLKQLKKENK